MQTNYSIPREINSEMKFTRHLGMTDLLVGGACIVLAFTVSGMVASNLMIPYLIAAAIIAILMILPSSKNPEKKTYQIIMLLIAKKRRTYHAIDNPYEPYEEDTAENE